MSLIPLREPPKQMIASLKKRPMVALGLLPDASVSIQVDQTAGAYILEEGQFYVVTNPSEINADDRVLVLARAYDRALQDQHFDLEAAQARARTTDAELAVVALIEGDGMLLAALYRYGDLVTADWAHLETLVFRTELPGFGDELDASHAWTRLLTLTTEARMSPKKKDQIRTGWF